MASLCAHGMPQLRAVGAGTLQTSIVVLGSVSWRPVGTHAPSTLLTSRPAAISALKLRGPGASRQRRPVVTCAAAGAAAAAPAASPVAALLAVVVGWVVIAGSCIRSLPQVLRILRNKSVEGLSLISFVSELSAYIITVAYNMRFDYPFSTWGDTFMSAAQHAFLVGLIFHYNRTVTTTQKVTITLGFAAATAFLLSSACTVSILTVLQASSVALLALGGRMPQIVLNLKRGNSGELSIASTALSVAGNLARVFTTMTLVGDPIILATATSQLVLNSILLWQTIDTARQVQRGAVAAPAS